MLRHIAANEPAVSAADPEGVHQMRVGVRRLRAAIAVFSELLDCKQTQQIKRDLKWLAGKLGPVRDLDVFLKGKIALFESSDSPVAGLPELKSELIYRRDIAAGSAKAAIATARYRLLIFNILDWVEDGKWLERSRRMEIGKSGRSPPIYSSGEPGRQGERPREPAKWARSRVTDCALQ